MRSCVLSRSGGGGGETSGKGRWSAELRLMGNDTNLAGGKGKGLEELRKGQQQRCDEGFAEPMDLGGASPLLREKRWVVGRVVSNKKDKHALAASDKRAIRFDLSLHYLIKALSRSVAKAHNITSPTSAYPHPRCPHSPIYKTGSEHSPHRSPSTVSANILSYIPTSHPVYVNLIPWIRTRRPRKQLLCLTPTLLLRSHSTVLDHYGGLPATRLVSQLIHALRPFVDSTRLVPIAVIASLVVHQQRPSFVIAPPDISFSARYDPCTTCTGLHATLL
jgi:hypothetical protein